MARKSKFLVDENEVMDSVEGKGVPEEKTAVEEGVIESNMSEGRVPVTDTKVEAEATTEVMNSGAVENEVIPKTANKDENVATENNASPVAQPGFSYTKKKEKRDVKKILLLTPTMNEQVLTLLEKTYDGMPFNMLVNDLLKGFVEKHGIKIDDNTF